MYVAAKVHKPGKGKKVKQGIAQPPAPQRTGPKKTEKQRAKRAQQSLKRSAAYHLKNFDTLLDIDEEMESHRSDEDDALPEGPSRDLPAPCEPQESFGSGRPRYPGFAELERYASGPEARKEVTLCYITRYSGYVQPARIASERVKVQQLDQRYRAALAVESLNVLPGYGDIHFNRRTAQKAESVPARPGSGYAAASIEMHSFLAALPRWRKVILVVRGLDGLTVHPEGLVELLSFWTDPADVGDLRKNRQVAEPCLEMEVDFFQKEMGPWALIGTNRIMHVMPDQRNGALQGWKCRNRLTLARLQAAAGTDEFITELRKLWHDMDLARRGTSEHLFLNNSRNDI